MISKHKLYKIAFVSTAVILMLLNIVGQSPIIMMTKIVAVETKHWIWGSNMWMWGSKV